MNRRRLATALVLVLAAAIAVPIWRLRPADRVLVAHFTRLVGVHEGSDVRVLGVRVGRVTKVRPQGRTVRVEMRYDRDLRVPAGATAIVVPPSVVSDRYVQLTPAYSGGAALADGADLPVERTSVPLEIDDIYRALDDFNKALGPTGANKDGALNDLLTVFEDEATVRDLSPDFAAIKALDNFRAVIATAPGSDYDYVSRFFAPRVGIDEDPVTGGAHTALAPYWAARLGRDPLVGFQASPRGGVVGTSVHGDRVRLRGRAVTVLDGTLTVNTP